METRESIENRLQELHRQRGRALLHGKSFQNELIVAEHRKLAEIEDMDAARAAQEREESAKASQAQVTAIRTELQDLDVSSLKALAQAETALRSAVAAMRLHHTHEAAKRKAIGRLNTLTGSKDSALSEFELFRRGSRLWLAQLNLLTNSPGSYGDLKFPSLHLPKPQKLGLTKGLNIMAAKETPPATSAEREILPISPRSLKVDLTTQTRRYLIVELDPALVLQDLNDHADSLWRLVQRGQTPVGPHDVIEFRAADWTATAKVSSIDGDAVYLYDVHRASKPARTVGLYEDDDYAIRQVGVRFGVFRKKHDNVNPHGGLTYATVAEAKQFLFSQYPKHRVA